VTTTERTGISAPSLREELHRPWTTVYRWADKAGIWDAHGSGRGVWFTPGEAAGLRTLSCAVDLLGDVREGVARQIVRAPGPVLQIEGDRVTSLSWEQVRKLLARRIPVVLLPVVEPEVSRLE
jgi:hypothetical protein